MTAFLIYLGLIVYSCPLLLILHKYKLKEGRCRSSLSWGLQHGVEESLCASGVHGCTGAECTGDACEYSDQ